MYSLGSGAVFGLDWPLTTGGGFGVPVAAASAATRFDAMSLARVALAAGRLCFSVGVSVRAGLSGDAAGRAILGAVTDGFAVTLAGVDWGVVVPAVGVLSRGHNRHAIAPAIPTTMTATVTFLADTRAV